MINWKLKELMTDLFSRKNQLVEETYEGNVISFEQNISGNELGGHRSFNVKYALDNERAIVIRSSADCHSDDAKITEHFVDKKIFEDMTKIILENKLYKAPECPNSDIEVCDGDSCSITVSYDNRNRFSYSDSKILTKEMEKAEKEIFSLIKSYETQGVRIPTIVSRNAMEKLDNTEIGKRSLHIERVEGKYLYFEIWNGIDEEFTMESDMRIYKLVNDEYKEYSTIEKAFEGEISAIYNYDTSVKVNKEDYFEPGIYKAVLAKLEDAFEVK